MADTAQGTTAATFNFIRAQHLMHGVAYERKCIEDLTTEQYSQLCDAVLSVEDAAETCKHTGLGLKMLLDLLECSDIEPYLVQSMRGLLLPLSTELNRTSTSLQAAIAQ